MSHISTTATTTTPPVMVVSSGLSSVSSVTVTPSLTGFPVTLDQCEVVQPYEKFQTFAQRSFSVFGPRLRNELPKDVQTTADYNQFKVKFKTHLFHKFVFNELD